MQEYNFENTKLGPTKIQFKVFYEIRKKDKYKYRNTIYKYVIFGLKI